MLKLNVSTKFKIAFNSIASVSLNSIQLTLLYSTHILTILTNFVNIMVRIRVEKGV